MNINDFQNCLNDRDFLTLVDDTSISLNNKDIKKLFDAGNKKLELVDQWLIANRLSVNVSKTRYCMFYLGMHNGLCTPKQTN